MSSSELLSVPFKYTPETELVEPFRKLFQTCSVARNFDKELAELNSLRSKIIPKNLNKSVAGLEELARYHDQIQALERKCPIEGLDIEFMWEDAFDKGSLMRGKASTSLPFLTFERHCVLFNIAALQSYLASEFRTSDSDDDLKTVAKWFQQASGTFAHLASSVAVLSNQELTPDLCLDTLEGLSLLMLAQAQEIFVTKAIKDRMKDLIIAKLSVQAEDMFAEALLKMTKETVKHIWDRAWLVNVAGKRMAYEAIAQFFQSKACGVNKRVGEQISRLNLSLELLVKAQDKLQNPNLYSYYLIEGNRLVTEAEKDNNFIYHEQIPSYNKLPTIEKIAAARLAKPTPFSSQELQPSFKDLFEDLQAITQWVGYPKLPSLDQPDQKISLPRPTRTSEPASSGAEASSPNVDPNSTPSPLKLALDASLNAVNYYMQQYLPGRKTE